MGEDVGGLTAEELTAVRTLIEIEKIRKKKLLYSQLMDSLRHEEFAELYTEDAIGEWGPFGTWHGREKILERIKLQFEGKPAFNWLHMTTNLWIELTGADTAVSRCYLHDVNTEPRPNISPTAWFGLYEEDWLKVDGDWKIKHHRIHFLWPGRELSSGFPREIAAS